MKNRHLIICVIILILTILASRGYSLKEETHKAINKDVAKRTINGFSLDSYLKNTLGFSKGYQELINGYSEIKKKYDNQEVFEWLGEGGVLEDRPGSNLDYIWNNPTRSVNHFHNPLKPWDQAGLDDWVTIRHYTGQSSVLWAQNTNQSLGGNWSWRDAREYFYIALTGKDFIGNNISPLPGETEKEKRERYFTYTFRGVGQQMHLVEDASVPEHVRNDAHPDMPMLGIKYYEGYVEDFRTKQNIYGTLWSDLLANPITFDKSILNITSTHPSAPVPISRIIDTDLYTGDNPNVTTTLYNSPQLIGIAEYTNANFLSEDTMFTIIDPLHSFNYPNVTNTILWLDNNNREYVRKVGSGDVINHLARTSLLYFYRQIYFPQYTEYLPLGLDEECYKEYAANLIPRAVGYSAGLLNYFFRGTLEITPPEQIAYAVTDGSLAPYVDANGNYHQQFRSIKAKIRNATPDTQPGEEIQAGILQAVARYKIISNYMYDLSNYPPDGSAMHNIEYSYSVSAPITITSLSSAEATEFTFDFSSSPIPAGITDLYLQVIFKGTLGNEQDIAVAVGMKDLMEPTHQVFWNLTDMFSLYIQQDTAYHLYLAYYNEEYPEVSCIRYDVSTMCDEGLFNMVDFNNNDIPNEIDEPYVDPYATTFRIGYLSGPPQQGESVYYSAIAALQPGKHLRLIALLDKPQGNYIVLESDAIFGTAYYYFTSPAVVNQEIDGVWQTPTPMTTFRYGLDIDGVTHVPVRQHFYTGIINCYPVGADPNGNPGCGYPQGEAIPGELSPSTIDTVYFP